MKFLLSNDDGIDAPGLQALAAAESLVLPQTRARSLMRRGLKLKSA